MRVPVNQQPNNQTSSTDPVITASSHLRITMTIQPQTRPETKKYRAIKRPDGVIVEYPRYQPTTSAPRQALQFERKLRTLDLPSTPSKVTPKKTQAVESLRAMDEDLMNVGAHFADCGRHGYNSPHALVHAGRGGYNATFDLRGEVPQQWGCGLMPMQRFLGEDGPWTGLEVRES